MWDNRKLICGLAIITISACQAAPNQGWHLTLSHGAEGHVVDGSQEKLVNAVRHGCQIRLAWGARRAADPSQTIEHSAEPLWLSVRNGLEVEVQIGGFMSNLIALGEPEEDHPRRVRFGGTSTAVMWRANVKTDGSFNAIWYDSVTGELIERIPQNHAMRWYADCNDRLGSPLYPDLETDKIDSFME